MKAYEKLTELQAGFRNGYSTVDNAFALYSIVTKYFNLRRKAVYVAFTDFEKAFDSVDRPILYDILHKNGVTGTLFTAIQAIYNNVKACVKSPDGISDEFICQVGLRQGCSLSPILFSLFINEMHNEFKSSNVRGIQLFPDLTEIFLFMFADDIVLISDTVTGLQKQLNILHEYCRDFNLKVNINKTKIMVFKRGGGLSKKEHWSYGGILLEIVKGFTYVGIYFTNRLSFFKMAESSTLKAKKVLNYLFSSFSKLSVLPAILF